MPQIDQTRPESQKRLIKAGIGLAVFVVVAAGVGFYLHWSSLPSAAATVSQAQTLDTAGNYASALSLLQGAYGRAFTTSDKVKLLPWLAATEYDMRNYSKALTYYEQLNRLAPNNESNLQMLGDTAYQVGNKSVALQAYEEELPLREASKSVGPTTSEENQDLEQRIADLKQ
jgi:tetratricopeptide (TPR) repeat protein